MAAAPERCAPELVDLSRLRADDLDALLEEERVSWRSALSWDFAASADLVRRFLRIQALTGFALMLRGRVVGYAYYVCEDRKGLIGDLYVIREYDSPEMEDMLLSAILQALISAPGVERIEAQLMMLRGPFERSIPLARHARIFPRLFMVAELDEIERLPEGAAASSARVEEWNPSRQDDAARLIAAAYREHVDSKINDQYRSFAGARRFLSNVVQYPGCGHFFSPGSLMAVREDGSVAGIVLSSLVASDVGHITQVCVAPEAHGRGYGYELLRQSLNTLRAYGCEKASLTVTASNAHAVQLYQRMGFRALRRFAAYVWEGF